MAKQLEAFSKEFGEVQKEVSAGMEDIKKYTVAVRQTSGVMEEGTKELGMRIQALKSKGIQGSKVDDFKSDKEVQAMMGTIGTAMKLIEKEIDRLTALHGGSFQKTRTRFANLKKELKKDIDDRKKQVTTLVGTGNKSLPELQKLMAAITKYDDDDYFEFGRFQPGKKEFMAHQLQEWIAAELAKTKSAAISQFQEMMMKQALDARNLTTKFGRVKALHDQYKLLASQIQGAAAAGKATDVLNAQAKLIALKNELDQIVLQYDHALKDPWLSVRINESDSKSSIHAHIQAMLKMKAETDKDYSVVAHLKAKAPAANTK